MNVITIFSSTLIIVFGNNMAFRSTLVATADRDSSSTSKCFVIAYELCGLIVKNGGKMDIENAVGQLSFTSKQFVFKIGTENFISQFPDLFKIISKSKTKSSYGGKSKSKVIVQATMPIKFCEDVKAKTGCRNSQCMKLHLCPYFIKDNSCTFGNKCRRSHDVGDPHTMRILQCFNLVVVGPKSLLEILRRVVDETEIERTASGLTVPDVCKFYNIEDGCSKGDNCPFLHVCLHFVDGDCKFGAGCKRDHNFNSKHNKTVLAEYNLSNLKERNILSSIKSVRKTRSDSMSSEANVAAMDKVRRPPVPEICSFYNSGQTCSRKESCPYLHICKYFVNGDCKFGSNCKRSHSFRISQNRKILENIGMSHLSDTDVNEWLQSKEPDKRTKANSSTDLGIVSQRSQTKVITSTPTKDHDDQNDICGYHLKGKCNYGDRCVRKHTDFPYLWQYQFYTSNSQVQSQNWHDFTSDLNEEIEVSYSNVQNTQCSVTIIRGKFQIEFSNCGNMVAKPVIGAFGVRGITFRCLNDMKVEIRRLTTSSSVVAPPGHLFSTTWKWYWKDEFGKWQSYDGASDRHLPSDTSSDVLEKKYLSGEMVHKFTTAKHSYTMYFTNWLQVNEQFKTVREVRRRPKLITKDIMKAIIGAKAVSGTNSRKSNVIIPSHWSKVPSGDDYKLELLQSISNEFKKTEARFCESMKGHRIVKIERVQNIGLWTDFEQKRQKLTRKSGDIPQERQLFHGTSPEIVEAICQQGFDWRVCGKHATAFGKGSYFAESADYSHRYTRSSQTSTVKMMFLSRVIVGSYTKGKSDMVKPPPKDPSKPYGVLYDSCVNDTAKPTIFVVFENGQSYPEFLISYL